jgi:hypothetical protein
MRTAQHRLSLRRYIEVRLGTGAGTQARNLLARPFGAGSFAGFWRYWNPVYGYVLFYWSYRPLRRVLPRAAAMWLTFVLCGLVLHDMVGWALGRNVRFPEMTILFAVFGLGTVAGEALGMDLSRRPAAVRVAANVAYLAASVVAWWAFIRVLEP